MVRVTSCDFVEDDELRLKLLKDSSSGEAAAAISCEERAGVDHTVEGDDDDDDDAWDTKSARLDGDDEAKGLQPERMANSMALACCSRNNIDK